MQKNKSRQLDNSYSDWRRTSETKTPNTYCLDIDFVEYIYKGDKIIPYVLIEVTEPTSDLQQCSWLNNIINYKHQQVNVLRYFSSKMSIPWVIVLTNLNSENKRVFKVYSDDFLSEKIYNEKEYLEILKKFKDEALTKIC